MLDPPRDGVKSEGTYEDSEISEWSVLVYIACKPTSLARDLEMIQGTGI